MNEFGIDHDEILNKSQWHDADDTFYIFIEVKDWDKYNENCMKPLIHKDRLKYSLLSARNIFNILKLRVLYILDVVITNKLFHISIK